MFQFKIKLIWKKKKNRKRGLEAEKMQGIRWSPAEKRKRQREDEGEEGGYLVKALPSGSASPTPLTQQTQNNRPSPDCVRVSVLKRYMFKRVRQDRRHECWSVTDGLFSIPVNTKTFVCSKLFIHNELLTIFGSLWSMYSTSKKKLKKKWFVLFYFYRLTLVNILFFTLAASKLITMKNIF